MAIEFDRSFDVTPGAPAALSPLVRRVLCNNPSPYTFRGTSTFIVGRGEVAIIDPGPDDDAHLKALLAAVQGETVSHILITHRHLDHTPLARKLKTATGAPIYAGSFGPSSGASDGVRLDASVDRSFTPDVTLQDAQILTGSTWTLQAVFTPGHLGDHMSYALAEDAALFCGDHVMAWATSVIAPPEGNMAQYMNSLRVLLDRDDKVFHPGHGPSSNRPKSLVRAYIAHRRMREEAILGRVQQGDRTVEDIVRAIYADVDPKLHGAAALSTKAHLDHLVEQGRIISTADQRYVGA